MNRIFRITEEMGHISDDIANAYNIDSAGARSVRNRLAHVYGQVDPETIYNILKYELKEIITACKAYKTDPNTQIATS